MEVPDFVTIHFELMRSILRQRTVAIGEELNQVELRRDIGVDLTIIGREQAGIIATRDRVGVIALDVQIVREPPAGTELDGLIITARFVEIPNAAKHAEILFELRALWIAFVERVDLGFELALVRG